jgi:sugar lactone lactonase YvrE/lysophospholipase L1-like esterase
VASRRIGILKKLALLFAVLVICLVVVEVVARISLGNRYPMNLTDQETQERNQLAHNVESKIFQRSDDRMVCYELMPGGHTRYKGQDYTINAHGMRGPDFKGVKPEGTFRVLMAGDSFTFGWGADDRETIPFFMEEILNSGGQGHARFEVLNSGVPGYTTGQMWELMQRKTLSFDPDLVVLMVSANDIIVERIHFDPLFEGLYTDYLPIPYRLKPVLWRLSVGYRYLVQRHKRFMESTGRVGSLGERDLHYFAANIRAIKEAVESRGKEFVLVLLPMLEDFNNYPYQKQHDDMHRVLEGIDCIDLLPSMRRYDVRDLWFTVHDHHLNGRANRAVARMILEALVKRGKVSLKPGTLPDEPFAEPLYKPGDLLVADMDADPMGRGGFHGAIFRVDPTSGEVSVVSADASFREPVDFVFDRQGNLLIVDTDADPTDIGASGAIFRMNRYSGRTVAVVSTKDFRFPNALLLDDDGKIYISDKESDPKPVGNQTGAVWVFDPSTRKLDLLAAGPQFVSPSPMAFATRRSLYLIDADANPNRVPGTPGVLFEIDKRTGKVSTLVEFGPDVVSPVGIVVLPDGRLLVTDANADPLKSGYYLGGLLLVDPIRRTYEIIYGSRRFQDPTRGDLTEDGILYFTDGNCDPLRLGVDGAGKGVEGHGHGAVWRFDLKSQQLDLVVSDARFVNPMSVKIVPETYER